MKALQLLGLTHSSATRVCSALLLLVLFPLGCRDELTDAGGRVLGPQTQGDGVVRSSNAPTVAADVGVRTDDVHTQNLPLPYSGSVNSTGAAFLVAQTGTGGAGSFGIQNASSGAHALEVSSWGRGATLLASNTGGGNAAYLTSAAASSGPTLFAVSLSRSSAGTFVINNLAATGAAVYGQTNGIGAAVHGVHGGSGGVGGLFVLYNRANPSAALSAETSGTGPGLQVNYNGPAPGDIAIFKSGGANQIRFNKNGKGFFNAGTQNGGADVAEAFEVEGSVSNYEPGDVLVISDKHSRRVEKSGEAYSTRVVGVYATKPGVLLTEHDIDVSLDDHIPLGVIGVIPTKVSAENGVIRLGDLLVSARTPGHAMRATPVKVHGVSIYPTGSLLGKALDEFAGPGTGVIRVLVSLK